MHSENGEGETDAIPDALRLLKSKGGTFLVSGTEVDKRVCEPRQKNLVDKGRRGSECVYKGR